MLGIDREYIFYDGIGVSSVTLAPKSGVTLILPPTHITDENRNGCIEVLEVNKYIRKWKTDSTENPISILIQSITLFNSGAGCSQIIDPFG